MSEAAGFSGEFNLREEGRIERYFLLQGYQLILTLVDIDTDEGPRVYFMENDNDIIPPN